MTPLGGRRRAQGRDEKAAAGGAAAGDWAGDLLAPPRPRLPADAVLGRPTAVAGSASASGRPEAYASFNVLLDDPAEKPALGFDDYATALAEMIANGRAEFAVGIFGGWGAGKTTLMRAIKSKLREVPAQDKVVSVWFAAWRYEKDPNLLLPLLDVLREALNAQDEGSSQWPRKVAVSVGRAGEAILAGLKVKASIAGVGADYEPRKTIEVLRARFRRPPPLSYSHKGFRMLHDAIRDLSAKGATRVVIFVDDLDRCAARNALEVLESMKLFFDVEGCVFVVGLDQKIAEDAVAVKYGAVTDRPEESNGDQKGPPSGTEFVKKLFQVHFVVPRFGERQLMEYLDDIADCDYFSAPQRADFVANVRPHFTFLKGVEKANPREIKRLINSYTVQLKTLSLRLGSLDPNVVLGLLCMNFHPDWELLFKQLAADPRYFQETAADVLADAESPSSVWLAGQKYGLPDSLVAYLRGPAAAVLDEPDLHAYVSAIESTWTTEAWVLEARTIVSRLRRAEEKFASAVYQAADLPNIARDIDDLYSTVSARREPAGRMGDRREQLDDALVKLMEVAHEMPAAVEENAMFAGRWADEAVPLLKTVDDILLEYHRYYSFGS
jgi:hypothetical protein